MNAKTIRNSHVQSYPPHGPYQPYDPYVLNMLFSACRVGFGNRGWEAHGTWDRSNSKFKGFKVQTQTNQTAKKVTAPYLVPVPSTYPPALPRQTSKVQHANLNLDKTSSNFFAFIHPCLDPRQCFVRLNSPLFGSRQQMEKR